MKPSTLKQRPARLPPLKLRQGKLTLTTPRTVRTFDLQLAMHPFNEVVLDVLNSLETDLLTVLDVEQEGTLLATLDGAEESNLSQASTKSASIRRWLAAGCQVIRWDRGDEIEQHVRQGVVTAMYRHNAAQVIFHLECVTFHPDLRLLWGR